VLGFDHSTNFKIAKCGRQDPAFEDFLNFFLGKHHLLDDEADDQKDKQSEYHSDERGGGQFLHRALP
jgi:hypothetical protein